jgi:hypothetical protein
MADKSSRRVFSALPFLVAIAILALNDHVLKTAWPGPFTGILSDIAGLFAFGFLAAAACGRRSLVGVTVVALGFVVWKTDVGLPLIQWWNSSVPWRISRVADPSDLLALAAVPFGAWAWRRTRPARAGRFAQGLAGTTAAFVVITSVANS